MLTYGMTKIASHFIDQSYLWSVSSFFLDAYTFTISIAALEEKENNKFASAVGIYDSRYLRCVYIPDNCIAVEKHLLRYRFRIPGSNDVVIITNVIILI